MSRFGAVRGSARREAWGTSVELGDGLFRIRLDNPVSGLTVNTYAYRGPRELAIFDPGYPWTLDALEAALRDLGLARSFVDVDAWVYTHSHTDHMGAAGLLSELSDAPHIAYRGLEPFLDAWHAFQDERNDWTAWGFRAFADETVAAELAAQIRRKRAQGIEFLVDAHGEYSVRNAQLLEFGDELTIDDLSLQFLDARGHDPYHGAFFSAERGWLIAGDVALATVTPISAAANDELEPYLATLDRLQSLGAKLLCPGHGVQRSGNLNPVFDRSRGYQLHYAERTMSILAEANEPLTLSEVGLRATADGKRFEDPARWAVHLALLDTHLSARVTAGSVERLDGPRYRAN